ncbi:MAG: hypothetical protein QOJ69_1227 [Actinomycetota bacterium]|jgi:hypothetical protein|nr:hypothetical protein [Actinomycetota bacterium]
MSAAAGEPEGVSDGPAAGIDAYAVLLAARFPWAGDQSIEQAAAFLLESDIEADGMDGSLGNDPLLVGRLMKEASTLAEIVDPPPVLG